MASKLFATGRRKSLSTSGRRSGLGAFLARAGQMKFWQMRKVSQRSLKSAGKNHPRVLKKMFGSVIGY